MGSGVRKEKEMNDDLGWQKPELYSRGRTKFHYFVHEPIDRLQNWQRSLCRRYGMPSSYRKEQDLNPPNDESCLECARRWRKLYGQREG